MRPAARNLVSAAGLWRLLRPIGLFAAAALADVYKRQVYTLNLAEHVILNGTNTFDL